MRLFAEVIGHTQVKQRLKAILRSGRLAQAYLFSGPWGIGKRIIAVEFAKGILCTRDPIGYCEGCTSCLAISKGIHPDLYMVVRDKQYQQIRIDQMRQMILRIGLKPALSDTKVAIVDEAERISEEGMNAILKTLEEPPGDTVLILVTQSKVSLLPTIQSRCVCIPFSPLRELELRRVLGDRHGLHGEPLDWVCCVAEGSPGMALKFFQQGIAFFKETLIEFQKGSLRRRWADLIALWADGERWDRERFKLVCHVLILALREVLRYKISGVLPIVAEERFVKEMGKRGHDEIIRLIEHLLETQRLVDLNLNLKILAHNVVQGFIE
jgi:DNA polymerase-3 subunit delta'